MLAAGPLLVAAGFAAMRIIPGTAIEFVPHLLPSMLLIGIGMTTAVAPLTNTVMASVDRHHAGAASGVNNATARIGGMVAVALIGLVLTGGGRGVSIQAFHVAMGLAAVVAAIAGVAGWFSAAAKQP
jgi:predicted MFS family arabinose efflux permease